MNENCNFILKKEEIVKTFNDYFGSIVDSLDLHDWGDKTSSPSNNSYKINDISRIMKNIQAFSVEKQNIEVLVNSHFGQISFEILRLTKLSVVK